MFPIWSFAWHTQAVVPDKAQAMDAIFAQLMLDMTALATAWHKYVGTRLVRKVLKPSPHRPWITTKDELADRKPVDKFGSRRAQTRQTDAIITISHANHFSSQVTPLPSALLTTGNRIAEFQIKLKPAMSAVGDRRIGAGPSVARKLITERLKNDTHVAVSSTLFQPKKIKD